MNRIDIGGTLRHHMWEGVSLYPLVEVTELPPRGGRDYLSYSQAVYTPVQSSTYLETAAHMYPERIKVADLPLDRLFSEAVVLQIPLEPREAITSAAIRSALMETGETIRPGDSLLISTGWDKMWDAANFISDSPYFAAEAIDWILAQRVALLGSDACQWDNGQQGFFPRFFLTETLLLGPLVRLTTISRPRVKLMTLPLKVSGTCAAPCRVIVEE
jgi:kynurenine formamidase